MTLKVMTWNVENLFRPGHAFGPKTKAIYTEKLEPTRQCDRGRVHRSDLPELLRRVEVEARRGLT